MVLCWGLQARRLQGIYLMTLGSKSNFQVKLRQISICLNFWASSKVIMVSTTYKHPITLKCQVKAILINYWNLALPKNAIPFDQFPITAVAVSLNKLQMHREDGLSVKQVPKIMMMMVVESIVILLFITIQTKKFPNLCVHCQLIVLNQCILKRFLLKIPLDIFCLKRRKDSIIALYLENWCMHTLSSPMPVGAWD